MKIKSLLALSFFLLIALKSFSQWTNDSTLNTVISDVPGFEEATPLEASTSDGKTFISYFENTASGYQMKMQLLDAQGNKLFGTSGLLVSSHPQNSALYVYDMKIDHADNAILAFQDERNGNLGVFAYKIDTTGTELWGVDGLTLHDDTATFELAPAIGVLSNNDVVVAWNASGTGSGKYIPFEKISSAGVIQWNTLFTVAGAPKFSRPTIIGISNERFDMIFIQETGNFPGTSTIYAQQYDVACLPIWPSNKMVSSYATGFAAYPQVTSDLNDGCYIAFLTGTPGNPSQNDVFAQHIDSSGNARWTANGVEASGLPTNNKDVRKIIFRASDHRLYLLLKVLDSSQSLSGVYAQALDTAGVPQLTTNGMQLVPLSTTLYAEPYDWADAGDGFMAVYTLGGFGNNLLYALKMDYTGQLTWVDKSVSKVASNKGNIFCGDFANNQIVCVWEDERIDRGIYAQNITTSGALGTVTGIKNLIADNNFTVSSLNDNSLSIKSSDAALFNCNIYSVEGKLIMEEKLYGLENRLSIENLSSGTYVFRLQSAKHSQSGFFQKN